MPTIGEHRYRIRSTGFSSHRYGPCEVCHKHASEVFIQSEERSYEVYADEPGFPGVGWTIDGCRMLFGHEQCLLGQRKQSIVERLSAVLHDGAEYGI